MNKVIEAGPVVGDEVKIDIQSELVKAAPEKAATAEKAAPEKPAKANATK